MLSDDGDDGDGGDDYGGDDRTGLGTTGGIGMLTSLVSGPGIVWEGCTGA